MDIFASPRSWKRVPRMRSARGANMIVLVDVGLKMTPHVSGNTDTIGNKRLRRCTLGCVERGGCWTALLLRRAPAHQRCVSLVHDQRASQHADAPLVYNCHEYKCSVQACTPLCGKWQCLSASKSGIEVRVFEQLQFSHIDEIGMGNFDHSDQRSFEIVAGRRSTPSLKALREFDHHKDGRILPNKAWCVVRDLRQDGPPLPPELVASSCMLRPQ